MTKKRTNETRLVEATLKEHFPNHPPDYPPMAYRTNLKWIYVRIVDRSFEKIPWMDRCDAVNPVLRLLPEKTQLDIARLFLFAPDEVEGSGVNYEFEHPTPAPRPQDRSRNGAEGPLVRRRRSRGGAKS